MKIMLAALIMLSFIGVGLIKLEKSDPAHAQNLAANTADAIAENTFYYINTVYQYVADNLITGSPSPIIDPQVANKNDKILDSYMLDSKNRDAIKTFETINKHLAYLSGSDPTGSYEVNYALITWKPIDQSSHPLGVMDKNYTLVNEGIMAALARIVDRQNLQLKNKKDIKIHPENYLPYVVGRVEDMRNPCNPKTFYIYTTETTQTDETKNTREYVDIYADLCTFANKGRNIGPYVIFKRITPKT